MRVAGGPMLQIFHRACQTSRDCLFYLLPLEEKPMDSVNTCNEVHNSRNIDNNNNINHINHIGIFNLSDEYKMYSSHLVANPSMFRVGYNNKYYSKLQPMNFWNMNTRLDTLGRDVTYFALQGYGYFEHRLPHLIELQLVFRMQPGVESESRPIWSKCEDWPGHNF